MLYTNNLTLQWVETIYPPDYNTPHVTLGLYSAFLACSAIFLRSNLQPRLTVDTIFLKLYFCLFSQSMLLEIIHKMSSNNKAGLYFEIYTVYLCELTHCNWGTIPDDSTDMGVIGVTGVNGAGVIGFSGKGDIPLWNDEVDWTLGGYRWDVWN